MVLRIVEEAMASRSHGYVDPNATIMNIPNNKVGLVIGRGGETIRELQEKSGCKIAVAPDNQQKVGSSERAISLSGDPTAIQRAKQMIEEIIEPQRMLVRCFYFPSYSKLSVDIRDRHPV
jgi:far upstream element-binding protein